MVLQKIALIMLLVLGGLVIGCDTQTVGSIANLFNSDCYVEGAITEAEFDDLPFWEKILYEKNSCDLYVKQDAGDIINHWF